VAGAHRARGAARVLVKFGRRRGGALGRAVGWVGRAAGSGHVCRGERGVVRRMHPSAEVLDYASVDPVAWVGDDGWGAVRRRGLLRLVERRWRARGRWPRVVGSSSALRSHRTRPSPVKGSRGVRSCWFIVWPDVTQLEDTVDLVQVGLVRGHVGMEEGFGGPR
jgi:hypothetical protein